MSIPAVINLDMDFFTNPPYIGRYYGSTEATSFSEFHSTSSLWLSSEDFLTKLDLKHRIHGDCMRNDNQSTLYIKEMIDQKLFEPKRFAIVNFDAHHDAYVHWNERWFRSVGIRLHNYDNMIAPFVNDWVDEIVWVTPDYMTDDMLRSQFSNMKVSYKGDLITVFISATWSINIRRIKWSNYNPEQFDWKYFCLITNPEMSKATPQMIADIKSHISIY